MRCSARERPGPPAFFGTQGGKAVKVTIYAVPGKEPLVASHVYTGSLVVLRPPAGAVEREFREVTGQEAEERPRTVLKVYGCGRYRGTLVSRGDAAAGFPWVFELDDWDADQLNHMLTVLYGWTSTLV